MPLIIPKELPAYDELSRENVFVMHRERAQSQNIRPLRILILNLMPTKIVTETQLARLLANSPLQVQLTFLQTATHSTTHTPPEHMKAFYKTFDEVRDQRLLHHSSVLGCAGRSLLSFRHSQGPSAPEDVRCL